VCLLVSLRPRSGRGANLFDLREDLEQLRRGLGDREEVNSFF
jgi:hypothetical protein